MVFEKQIDKIKALGILGMIIGILLLIIGIAGLFVPIVPGIIFIIVGLLILGVDIPFLKKLEEKHSGEKTKLKKGFKKKF